MNKRTAAIIVAAGSSQRLKEVCKDKLLLDVAGIPVLARTLINYQKAESIDDIYVVTRPQLFETVEGFAAEYGITKYRGCTEGGMTRQHSVLCGLSLCPDAHIVAIADGARPFTTPELIDQVSAVAKEKGAALLCVPLKDTVKHLSPDGIIDHTPPRKELLAAQTPQTFLRAPFVECMERSIAEGKEVTDDASVFELYSRPVWPVTGDYNNIKITTKEDILQANLIAGKDAQ